jgi:uncharacterized membrane protein required for colicin V production
MRKTEVSRTSAASRVGFVVSVVAVVASLIRSVSIVGIIGRIIVGFIARIVVVVRGSVAGLLFSILWVVVSESEAELDADIL